MKNIIKNVNHENAININVNELTETQAIWLSSLFKKEMEEAIGAANNEHIFMLGSDGESAIQHQENEDENRSYAAMMKNAYDQVQKFWK